MTQIRELIYKRLDDVDYLAQGRVENGRVMEQLARDPAIGGRIAEYTGKEKVKTYIKDGVINRYAKEKTRPPSDLSSTVSAVIGENTTKLDGKGAIGLYRSSGGAVVVVSCGRLLKWETALRKLLEYLGGNDERLERGGAGKRVLLLVLMTGGQRLSSADKDLLERSLEAIQVKVKLL